MEYQYSNLCMEQHSGLLSQQKWASRSWKYKKTLILFSCFSLLSMVLDSPVYSQTLDEAIAAQLDVSCTGLLGSQGTDPGLGANLNLFCATPTTSSGGSVGGGGGAVQSTGVSVSNATIRHRLDEARSGENTEKGLSGASGSQGMNASFESERIWNSLGLFASGNVEYLERDTTTFANGYVSTILGLTGGADYRFNEKLLGGVAINFQNQNGDFKGDGGSFSKNSYQATVFASFTPSTNTFIQLLAGYTRDDYDVIRAVSYSFVRSGSTISTSGRVTSDSDINVFNMGVLLGRDYLISKINVGPRVGLNYSNSHILDYRESGSHTGLELVYDDQWINSLQSTLGVVVSMPVSTGIGVFLPQISADYIHEFANGQRDVTVRFAEDFRANPTRFKFLTDGPARDFVNLGFGVSAVLPHGIQPFANFRAMVGNEQFENYAGTFGIRIELGAT